jgi:hypothetical protein
MRLGFLLYFSPNENPVPFLSIDRAWSRGRDRECITIKLSECALQGKFAMDLTTAKGDMLDED